MISSGMIGTGPGIAALGADLTDRRTRFRSKIEARACAYVDRALRAALLVSTVLQGLSIQVHDGANREDLAAVVDAAIMALDQIESVVR